MNSQTTLKLNKDFRRLYYRGRSVSCRTIVVYAQKNRCGHSRLGLTCGKVIGSAVQRNRAKRLMRESYRLLSDRLCPGYDVVIVARCAISNKKCSAVLGDLSYAFSKLDMIK